MANRIQWLLVIGTMNGHKLEESRRERKGAQEVANIGFLHSRNDINHKSGAIIRS